MRLLFIGRSYGREGGVGLEPGFRCSPWRRSCGDSRRR